MRQKINKLIWEQHKSIEFQYHRSIDIVKIGKNFWDLWINLEADISFENVTDEFLNIQCLFFY